MIYHNKIKSHDRPEEISFTPSAVYVASNIEPYEEELEGKIISGYQYDITQYSKDEYIIALAAKNAQLEAELLNTQAALCDIYELIEGGLE